MQKRNSASLFFKSLNIGILFGTVTQKPLFPQLIQSPLQKQRHCVMAWGGPPTVSLQPGRADSSKSDHGPRLEALQAIKDTKEFLGFAGHSSSLIPLSLQIPFGWPPGKKLYIHLKWLQPSSWKIYSPLHPCVCLHIPLSRFMLEIDVPSLRMVLSRLIIWKH